MDKVIWSEGDMIEAACEWWGDAEAVDCKVIRDGDRLVILHAPTGRTSGEAGDGGRWNLDRTAC